MTHQHTETKKHFP